MPVEQFTNGAQATLASALSAMAASALKCHET